MRFIRLVMIVALGTVCSVYSVICVLFAIHVQVFVATGGAPVTPEAAGLHGFTAVSVPTDDGERLSGWWSPPRPGRGAVLLLLGNGGVDLSVMAPVLADLAARGLGALGVEYRGNRGSTGVPSEAGVYADARGAYDFIARVEPGAGIAVFGGSFGSGVAVQLACERPVAGLVLDSAYSSILSLLDKPGAFPLPYRLLLGDPLDSISKIGKVKAPLMIVAGTADDRIPLSEPRRLYAAANEPKTLIEVDGAGHGGAYQAGARERVLAALDRWTAGAPANAERPQTSP